MSLFLRISVFQTFDLFHNAENILKYQSTMFPSKVDRRIKRKIKALKLIE